MFCQTRSKVALVEFLCLIFSQRNVLVLTLPLCANMWNQQFSLIGERLGCCLQKKIQKLYKCFMLACGCAINTGLLQLYEQVLCIWAGGKSTFLILFLLCSGTNQGNTAP